MSLGVITLGVFKVAFPSNKLIYGLFFGQQCSEAIPCEYIFTEMEEIRVRWGGNNSPMYDGKTRDIALKYMVEEDRANISGGKL